MGLRNAALGLAALAGVAATPTDAHATDTQFCTSGQFAEHFVDRPSEGKRNAPQIPVGDFDTATTDYSGLVGTAVRTLLTPESKAEWHLSQIEEMRSVTEITAALEAVRAKTYLRSGNVDNINEGIEEMEALVAEATALHLVWKEVAQGSGKPVKKKDIDVNQEEVNDIRLTRMFDGPFANDATHAAVIVSPELRQFLISTDGNCPAIDTTLPEVEAPEPAPEFEGEETPEAAVERFERTEAELRAYLGLIATMSGAVDIGWLKNL